MVRRLDKTLADYVGIAISPVLIMTMVGSLVFFLLEVFYQGQYEERLRVVLALFVMAIVLIGRISIEMGQQQAQLYAAPLAIVTALATMGLTSHGWLFNLGLLGLIWWSAHKLTWDCTLIDENEDSSGEGVLQSTGLDNLFRRTKAEDHARRGSPDPAETPDPQVSAAHGRPSVMPVARSGDRPQHQTAPDVPEPAEPEAQPKKPDKCKPHAPGVWIVYFSLAALPLFGLGEVFLGNQPERRRYAFSLLLIYVASGLGLLLSTSFLGLRRYLRQRHLQMPASMAGLWIGFGVAILVALLVLAAMLPRPGTERSAFQSPIVVRSPERKASPYAVGNDGAEGRGAPGAQRPQVDKQPAATQAGSGGRQQQSQPASGGQSGSAGRQPSSSGQPSAGQQTGGSEQKSGQESNTPSQADQASGGSGRPQSEQQRGERQPMAQAEKQPSGGSDREQSQRRSDGDSKGGSAAGSGGRQEPQGQRDGRSAGQAGSQTSQGQQSQDSASKGSSPPSWSMPEVSVGLASGWLLATLRWILYIVLAAVGLVWLWRSRQSVAAAIRDLLRAVRDLWASLFGGRKNRPEKVEAEQAAPAIPTPFAAFSDPFANGTAGRYTSEQLVRYTFEAMEAWARERGCVRPPDQTVHEFARCVANRAPALAQDAQHLADLYNRAAYSPSTLEPSAVEPLRQAWQLMRADQGFPPRREP